MERVAIIIKLSLLLRSIREKESLKARVISKIKVIIYGFLWDQCCYLEL